MAKNTEPEQGTLFDNMVDASAESQPAAAVDPAEEEAPIGALALGSFSNEIHMEADDIVIPRLRLAQGLTAEVQDGSAKPGQWLLTGYEGKEELTVIPMLFARNRNLRDSEGQTVLCKSHDGITGVGDPGGTCSSCPMNKWADGPKGERIPPQCVFSYVYIVYVVEYNTMALVEFRRTSIQAGKTLNTISASRGLGNFAVKLAGTKQTGKRGTWYQMLVRPTQVDESVLEEARSYSAGA